MKSFLVPIALALTLSGCTPSVPDCGDEKTTSLVKQLVLQNLLGEESAKLTEMFKVEVNAVQTLSHAKDPEKYECKANIKVKAAGKLDELIKAANDEIPRMQPLDVSFRNSGIDKMNKSGTLMSESETWEKIPKFFKIAQKIDRYLGVGYLPGYFQDATRGVFDVEASIGFTSTSVQQGDGNQHYVEIERLWNQPSLRVILLAEIAKSYDPTPPVKESKPAQPVEPTQSKLSPAAEEAVRSGFVEIKNPAVQACTDEKIAAIKKQAGEDAVINYETYNEAAVACGFNI